MACIVAGHDLQHPGPTELSLGGRYEHRGQLRPGPMACLLLQSATMHAASYGKLVANWCMMTDDVIVPCPAAVPADSFSMRLS